MSRWTLLRRVFIGDSAAGRAAAMLSTGAAGGVAVMQFAILYVALRGLGCRRSRVAAGLHRWAIGALAFGHPGEDLLHRIFGVDGRRPPQRLAGTSRVEERR